MILGFILGILSILGLQAFGLFGMWLLGKATTDVDYGDWEEQELNNQNARINAEK